MVKKVGKYEIGRTLGEGTFGKVKYAVNTENNEAVAIKILDKERIQQQNMGNQIKKEISIMKMVNHKYVVQLIEVLASKTKIFIVLELVTGGELFDKIVSSKRLNEEQAKFYFSQLVEGVEYCHNLGVCHRDLKPENLLLDEHGNLKISDFGLSSLYVGDAESDAETRTQLLHTTCGTPNYVAPEVISDQGYDGKKADVWSIGVILYVLLAGFLPFDESTITNLFNKIKSAEYTYPSWFSNEAKAVIDRMLVADPKKRISLSELKEHPWLQSVPKDYKLEDKTTSDTFKSSTKIGEVISDAGKVIEGSDDDIDDDYVGSFSSRKPRVLNAFDLIVKSGGFRLDRMFRPEIFLSINESSQSSRLNRLDSSNNPGVLRFGSTIIRTNNSHKFTSNVTPPEELMKIIYSSCSSNGFTFSESLESMLVSGKAKASKITDKGVIGMSFQVFELSNNLSFLEIKKGKGDILTWNQLYRDIIDKYLASKINKKSNI